jgi:hypothetical protein
LVDATEALITQSRRDVQKLTKATNGLVRTLRAWDEQSVQNALPSHVHHRLRGLHIVSSRAEPHQSFRGEIDYDGSGAAWKFPESSASANQQVVPPTQQALILPTAILDLANTDAGRAISAAIITALYANPRFRQLAQSIWLQMPQDPVLVILCIISACLIRQYFNSRSSQISLLGDDSLMFEDAFGITIRLPYVQCKSFTTFNAFLQCYYQGKPGESDVLENSFCIMMGSSRSQEVFADSWEPAIKPRSRLTMMIVRYMPNLKCSTCVAGINMARFNDNRGWTPA